MLSTISFSLIGGISGGNRNGTFNEEVVKDARGFIQEMTKTVDKDVILAEKRRLEKTKKSTGRDKDNTEKED